MIYRLDFDLDKYSALFIDPDEMEEVMDDLYYPEGEPLSGEWNAPKGVLCDGKDQGRDLESSDICTWEGNLVLGPKAYELLGDKLRPYSELLPVYVNSELWYVVNILTVTDAVDYTKSEQDLRGGIYVGLKSLQFNEGMLTNILLFKTDFDEKVGNFCNERFREEVEDTCRLTGVVFRTNLERP
ncbi:hypothetical protein M3P05_18200 [Sansalvadorimonas sp. 2012CJ34-2]|uniref:Immunity MXAN-0049 protein domain-containing protein n=1 Tax=Parendozoicomonas callyspongiae TaxID=2942213 RepID=A0ABT0PKI9_9GAMM|nr:DUF1629 domain-containing protein [Sansalvadorimonas sp. 2012CJ34-2]MCL6271853.1 hypothetical protein [Sansalvadorimonas sp. 2012CJ34-2]